VRQLRNAAVAIGSARVGRRPRLILAWLLLVAVATIGVLAVGPIGGAFSQALFPQLLAELPGGIQFREPGYTLVLDPTNGNLSVGSPQRRLYTTFPLTVLAGLTTLPRGIHRSFRRSGADLVEVITAGDGTPLETVTLTASATSFTVTFSSRVGPDSDLGPSFFFDGTRGLDLRSVTSGFTPSSPNQYTTLPSVYSLRRAPLTPPPLDVELKTPAGWLGIGLVHVPNATSLGLLPNGAVSVDYPLDVLTTFDDSGAGGRAGSMVRFPAFVFTFATGALEGLQAYGQSLVRLRQAPAAWAPRPSWWQEPIVDTWGAQVEDQAARSSPGFTAAWVQDFAATSQRRLSLNRMTLVIDSRWQQSIGEPEPDAVRFGGWTGMRALIDQLHSQGFHVVLWWPMWVRGIPHVPPSRSQLRLATSAQLIDPTAPGFEAAMADTMQRLLGNDPGDLNADGVKLDWTYDIRPNVQNPALGWGDAALYRYLEVIDGAADAARPDALVEASAAAPQFARVTDAVRLYDAWSDATWQARAAVVSAADPTALIDGDGWQANATNALPHAVTSTVYGIPALYFSDRWADGSPMSTEMARQLGQVMALAPLKGDGTARQLSGGEWAWVARGRVQAETLDGGRDVVLWSQVCGGLRGTLVTTNANTVLLPTPPADQVRISESDGSAVHATQTAHGMSVPVEEGQRYSISGQSRC
jgi:hypothetical protein